jgi:hypothetical protein
MSEATGFKDSIEESEAEVLQALDRYFEVRRHELEDSKKRAGSEYEKFEEARRQLMGAEQELEQIQRRTAYLKGEALNTVMESSEASELEEGVTELQRARAGAQEGGRRKAQTNDGPRAHPEAHSRGLR